ncbi:hypothetical protein OGAPHI_007227 [Ogataea philodendri]|uniref:Presequence protease, mitochondrial n=1 Tax=Ogataea philodendri TaxID=1378263 RepID=A0A9P8NV97_9ASCO|nr:uncharacterized protein OGAPHI_007227 [Ogataea philodendri]KAH3660022.1 hypothetical protein OGAPHI_007227 [Ogataea philodendri]
MSLRRLATVAHGKYGPGQKIHGFEVLRTLPVPEFGLTAVDLVHERTGSKHLHIDRQDKNNVFSMVFKTNPPDSTGLPHILEHTTLCGSEKYPVRDPFFKMLNRSLSNFMNAMTGHDYTYYPFATTNKTDFYNLMDVYLDSTMNPLLTEDDFYQEGWRLENQQTNDKSSPLQFKGVVYNEMKGQMSDSGYWFWIKFQEAIYPSLNNSGGDPSKMTDLVYEDLVDFHSRFYHPSNGYTFTYGNLPLSGHLEKINEKYNRFGKRTRRMDVKEPIELAEHTSVRVAGPVDPMLPAEKQFKSSLTWYCGKPDDIYESFVMKMLSNLLMDGHSSPLYQDLIEAGIGSDFSINSGFDSMTDVNMFSIGLQGMSKEAADALPETIGTAIRKSLGAGFGKDKIDAMIHQYEIGRKVESASFGLNILNAVVPGWVNRVDPLEMLQWDSIIGRFKEDYAHKGDAMFKELGEKYLLSGAYFHYTMYPDQQLELEIQQEEEARLRQKVEKLNEDDKKVLFERGVKLLEKQSKQEDLTCLPSLSTSDINRDGDTVRIGQKSLGQTEIYTRVSPKTNGLTYFRSLKTLSSEQIPEELLKYLPLFTECLTNLGTKNKSMAQLEDEIKLYTGGISPSVFCHSSPESLDTAYLKFSLGGVALNSNFDKLLDLSYELLSETDFDNLDKLSVLVKSLTSDNLSSIISSGHSYARGYSSSQLVPSAKIQEVLGGIEQIQFLNELRRLDEQKRLGEVSKILKQIRASILEGSNFQFGVTTDRLNASFQEQLVSRYSERIGNSLHIVPYHTEASGLHENNVIEVPSQVSFAAAATLGSAYMNQTGAALQVLAQLCTFKHLHGEIREKGGAYGGGATYDALNGVFAYYSFRDPNPGQSVAIFSKTIEAVAELIHTGKISEEDLGQAKLSIFQSVDCPQSVRSEGAAMFNYGIDDEMRQSRREWLLDCDLEGLLATASESFKSPLSNTIVGAENGLGWKKVTIGLDEA